MERRGKPEVLAQQLATEINGLEAGTPLPSEQALALRFQVSRVVVRETFTRLRATGLVRTEPGRGHFVADVPPPEPIQVFADPPSDLRSLLQIVELRAALESQAAALAARRRSQDDIARMESAVERMRAAIEDGQIELGVAADFDFHSAILAATGNEYFRRYAQIVTQPLFETIRAAREYSAGRSAQRWQAQREHEQILEAIRNGNPRSARAAAQRHVDNTAKRLASANATAAESTHTTQQDKNDG